MTGITLSNGGAYLLENTHSQYARLVLMAMKAKGLAVVVSVAFMMLMGLLYVSHHPGYVEQSIQISQLISASIHLAEQSGEKIVAIRKLDDTQIGKLSKGLTKEGANDYITLGDKESHKIITSGLLAIWPKLNLRSEERSEPQQGTPSVIPPVAFNAEVMNAVGRDEKVFLRDVVVWVDPLDATQEYTEGGKNPELLNYVTVMLCIAVNGEPVAGIIHQPFAMDQRKARTYWGWVGHGFSKTVLESVDHTTKNPHSVNLVVSRTHPGDVAELANRSFGGWKYVKHVSAAGAGYKSLAVVRGVADVYLHTTEIRKWDICAGDAMLRTVGGKMTNLHGEKVTYSPLSEAKTEGGVLAARTETSHKEYLERLKLSGH